MFFTIISAIGKVLPSRQDNDPICPQKSASGMGAETIRGSIPLIFHF
jgi:hypothetical protein